MKYFTHMNHWCFHKEPSEFSKYTPKNVLKYAIGANMYMPATQSNIFQKLIENNYHDIGAITLCMEDAIAEENLDAAQKNVLSILSSIHEAKKYGDVRLPLIFVRVRNPKQFREFANMLEEDHLEELCGFCFPKFTKENGFEYFRQLEELRRDGEVLYAMPIIETPEVMHAETRKRELCGISDILRQYKDEVLNIRVGGTDFSSIYGLRRRVEHTIYDIRTVADCMVDILNFFLREECGYVVSGPVWEYFSWDENSIESRMLKKELRLDIQNGFHGKTIIHPSQIDIVNQEYIVWYDEYMDAINIKKSKGGAFKGYSGNRMNETLPHMRWADKILAKAEIFGVYDKRRLYEQIL